MNTIKIMKTDITDLAADAVVNAANEGLWAGSGVCGAIFAAAGYEKLQAACNEIFHCDTGSAVITPGFGLKAKYIIHAVGPVWRGDSRNEPQLLYDANFNALTLSFDRLPADLGGDIRLSEGQSMVTCDSGVQRFL